MKNIKNTREKQQACTQNPSLDLFSHTSQGEDLLMVDLGGGGEVVEFPSHIINCFMYWQKQPLQKLSIYSFAREKGYG